MKSNLTLKLIIIFLTGSVKLFAQSTGNNAYSPSGYLGWSTSGGPLPFIINSNQYMSLTTGGLFGIGTSFNPVFKLDVDGGDINLNSLTNAYRIGDGSTGNSFKILWHNGIVNNIYVGVGAGNTNATYNNTFVGQISKPLLMILIPALALMLVGLLGDHSIAFLV